MKLKVLAALFVLVFSLYQLSSGLPGWDSIYHGAMSKWVAENGITGWVDNYEEQYSYPPGLHLLASFFIGTHLQPAKICYIIASLFLALTVLSLKNGTIFAASRPAYNLLFAGFFPNSIGLYFFSLIYRFKKLVPILVGGLMLISPSSVLGVGILAIFLPEIRKGFLLGLLLASPWVISNWSDFSKFADHTSLKLAEIIPTFHTALIVLLVGFLSKNKLPILTFFLLAFNPLVGLWDRLVYFAFLLAVENFNYKLAIPILLLSLQMAPIVTQDWSLLFWAQQNLDGEALAEPVLRPSLLAVAEMPVYHEIGWKNEDQYQSYISCKDTDPPVSSIIMKQLCKAYANLPLVYQGEYNIITKR